MAQKHADWPRMDLRSCSKTVTATFDRFEKGGTRQ